MVSSSLNVEGGKISTKFFPSQMIQLIFDIVDKVRITSLRAIHGKTFENATRLEDKETISVKH